MQRLGFAIFVAGVIVSSWYAARYIPPASIQGSGKDGAITSMDRLEAWGGVAGAPFAGGALLMMAGGIIARRAMAHKAKAGALGDGEQEDTHTMLAGIEAAIAALPEGDPEQHAEDLRKQLDVLLDELIPGIPGCPPAPRTAPQRGWLCRTQQRLRQYRAGAGARMERLDG